MTPRTLYIDPGTANTAWLIAEPDPARGRQDLTIPLRCVDHDKIETGTKVDRPPERVTSYIRKSDGVEIVQDKERVVTPADRRRVGDALVEIAKRHGVTRAVVEMMGRVHLHGSPAAQWAQAESARQTGKVEELILDRLEAAGVEVVTVARSKWAARLRVFLPVKVKGAPSMSRKELLPVLDLGFGGTWPSRAGEDERDCGGMALWDALPALVPARKAGTGSPRRPKPKPWVVKVGALYLADAEDAALSDEPRDAQRFDEAGATLATIGIAGAVACQADPAALRTKRGPRGALDKAKQRKRRLELAAERRPAHEAALSAARVAAGCTCGAHRGRHAATCPKHKGKPPKVETVGRADRRARLAAHDRACGDL